MELVLTFVALGLLALLTLSGIARQSAGEPILPWIQPSSGNHLPHGVNYQIDALDPTTLAPMATLPQKGMVELRLAVTNDSALPVTFSFPTSMQCEFVARKVHTYVGGLFVLPLEVWRSSYFHNVSRHASRLTLNPAQTKVYVANWTLDPFDTGEASAGTYQVSASFGKSTIPLHIDKPL